MTEYTITVENYETGLTANALESQIRDSFMQDVVVNVEESLRERTSMPNDE